MNENTYFRLAFKDIAGGISQIHVAYILGVSDIKQRYARSRLGQFWITLSMLIFIVSIGIVYSFIFHQNIRQFLPYIACNYIVWSWIAANVSDSTNVFLQAKGYIKQTSIPRSVFVLRVLVRNLIGLGHNLLIIPLVFLCLLHPLSWTMVLALPGMALIVGCGFFACLSIGVVCVRFRDLPQIVQSLMQIMLFLTPVMWPISSLGQRAQIIVEYNPFAALMRVVSEPLQGIVPSLQEYAVSGLAFVVLAGIGLTIFSRFRARIVYWL